MTTGPDNTESAGIDSYIARHLSDAAAALTSHVDIQAKLDTILGAGGHGNTVSDTADVIHKD